MMMVAKKIFCELWYIIMMVIKLILIGYKGGKYILWLSIKASLVSITNDGTDLNFILSMGSRW